MSDVMLFGVLRMPYELAMGDELSRFQFYARVGEALDRLERAEEDLRTAAEVERNRIIDLLRALGPKEPNCVWEAAYAHVVDECVKAITGEEEDTTDAQLIAAAPELLTSLKGDQQ